MRIMKPIHLLLIDDHAMFRSGLRALFKASLPEAVLFEAGSLDQALAEEMPIPDVVLLDIKLPGQSGMEGISLLKARWPPVPVLMLSSLDTPETVRHALTCGAAGFVSKAETADRIIDLTHRAASGRLSPPSISADEPAVRFLTPRQHEVLGLLGLGQSNRFIARKLSLSENTVRRHVQDILEHFAVSSRSEAVYSARCRGLIG